MVTLVRRYKRVRQPAAAIRPSALARELGCGLLLLPQFPGINFAGPTYYSATAGSASASTLESSHARTYLNGSDTYATDGALQAVDGYWFCFRGYISAVGTWDTVMCRLRDNAATEFSWGWYRSSTSNVLSVQNGTSIQNPRVLNDLLDTTPRTWVGLWRPGTTGNLELWRDGKLEMSSGFSTAPSITSGEGLIRLGGSASSAAWTFMAHGAGVALQSEQAAELSVKPWLLLAPRRIFVPVSVGGGGAQSIAITQPSETDTAQPFTALRTLTTAIGQPSETDSAQPVTAIRTRVLAIGQPAEADAAQSVAVATTRTLAIGQATELDTAQPVSAGGTTVQAIGQASETDTAQPAAALRTIAAAIGQPQETDAAQPATAIRTRVLAVGQPAEADTAQPVSTGGTTVQAIAQAVEADSAQPVTAVRTLVRPVLQAQETDSAQPVTPIIGGFTLIGQAQEVDTAQPVIVVPGARGVVVGQAVETDTAQAAAVQAVRTITAGMALEIDTAQAFTAFTGGLTVGIGQAVEADLAFAVSIIGGDTSYIPRGTLQAAIIVAPDNNTVYVPYEDRTIHAR